MNYDFGAVVIFLVMLHSGATVCRFLRKRVCIHAMAVVVDRLVQSDDSLRLQLTRMSRVCHILPARGGPVGTVFAHIRLNPGCILGDSREPSGIAPTARSMTEGRDTHLHILACRCATNKQRTSRISLTDTLCSSSTNLIRVFEGCCTINIRASTSTKCIH